MAERVLSAEEVVRLGMVTNHEQMDNGEYQFRFMNERDGSGYIRTVAGEVGAWQNSHSHKGACEFIAVQSGWIAFAEEHAQLHGVMIRIVRAGGTVIIKPRVRHNVYMSAGTITHCVKFGDTAGEKADWPFAYMDALTKHLTEEEILAFAH